MSKINGLLSLATKMGESVAERDGWHATTRAANDAGIVWASNMRTQLAHTGELELADLTINAFMEIARNTLHGLRCAPASRVLARGIAVLRAALIDCEPEHCEVHDMIAQLGRVSDAMTSMLDAMGACS